MLHARRHGTLDVTSRFLSRSRVAPLALFSGRLCQAVRTHSLTFLLARSLLPLGRLGERSAVCAPLRIDAGIAEW